MDDLEHSVVIAERDWESFYEESEECSIQPAWLASLDESGFSDTDDEKNPSQEPVLDLQVKCGKPKKEADATPLIQSGADDCKAEKPSEEPNLLNYKKDDKRCEQIEKISLNDASTTCACFNSDSRVSVNHAIFTDQQHTALSIKDLIANNESCSKDNSCIQDVEHVGSSEEETALKVLESSATTKKEKERWFVTVNDSPRMPRVKSGQKKEQKKKTPNKLGQQSTATERKCSVSSNKEEEIMKNRQELQNECMQPPQAYSQNTDFNPSPNYFCENINLGLCNYQEVVLSSVKKPEKEAFKKCSTSTIYCASKVSSFIAEEENTSCAFSFNCKDNSDVLTETAAKNLPASVNSPFPLMLTDTQFQNEDLANDQNIANESKNITKATTPDHQITNNLSQKVCEETQDDSSKFILNTCSKMLQEKEYQTEKQEEMKVPSQEIQNHGSQKESLETAVGPNCPIYALSPFWDDMEKLTINDILHLRSNHNRSPMSVSVITEESDIHLDDKELLISKHDSLQESSLMDDSADSDYFTHVDESKPGCSSCELSNLSDFDEEFLQSPEPQHVKEQMEVFKSTYTLVHEFDSNNKSESLDTIKLSHQDEIPHYMYPNTEVQRIILASNQDGDVNPFELKVMRKTPVLTFAHSADNQSMLNFSEVSEETDTSDILAKTAMPFSFVQKMSVCEMYDDFFSDFEIGNFFFPSIQEQPVPIFSASRSLLGDLVFPEVDHLETDPDFKDDNMPIRDKTCFSSQPEISTSPSGMPNLCFSMGQRGNWSSIFSLRRTRFIGKESTWHHKVSSWILPKEGKKATSYLSKAQQITPLLQMANKSFLQLAEPQKHAIIISNNEDFSIRQADMCLVCIAFSSWVLKSSNSQSTDMWKAALLASVSAISAIQYLRNMEKDTAKDGL
ncbi:hypothetical protein C0J50_2864 [Silurus asotus]|uniref:PGC-1 and ERR-induced regulator in muscle protein 1 n=1 Tax=Silurus asotus TaxID=30991 RepID=A0AAD5B711_SILAS|nr:hypothetical protein C0J50_2864 [Silurus asotus]